MKNLYTENICNIINYLKEFGLFKKEDKDQYNFDSLWC